MSNRHDDDNRDDDDGALWARHARGRRPPEQSICPGEEALAAYLDGGTDAAERATLEEHLVTCRSCQAGVGEAVRIQRSARAPVPPALLERLRGAIAAELSAERAAPAAQRRRRAGLPAWMALAAALGAVAWGGFFLGASTLSGRARLSELAIAEASFGLAETLVPEAGPPSGKAAR